MAKGDHLCVKVWLGSHLLTRHSIDCGNGFVIEYDGQKVRKLFKTAFSQNQTINIVEYIFRDDSETIVQRANRCVAAANYNLPIQDSESFAYWCVTGKEKQKTVKTQTQNSQSYRTEVNSKTKYSNSHKHSPRTTKPQHLVGQKGDNIYIRLWSEGRIYNHHGIDCGDGFVIEYSRKEGVRKVTKSTFSRGHTIYVDNQHSWCYDPDTVVAMAHSLLGETEYCLWFRNCEHFARWCKEGKWESRQVERAEKVVRTGGSLAKEVCVTAANNTAKSSLNPISKTLVNVGIKKAPIAVTRAASVGGLASGLATDLVVGQMLKDDESLPEYKQKARKLGRTAGTVGTAIGGVAGVAVGTAIGGTAAVTASVVAAPVVVGTTCAFGVYKFAKEHFKKRRKK